MLLHIQMNGSVLKVIFVNSDKITDSSTVTIKNFTSWNSLTTPLTVESGENFYIAG